MNKSVLLFIGTLLLLSAGCAKKIVLLTDSNLKMVNRSITSFDRDANAIALNGVPGDGLAICEDVDFTTGSIEVELKGENTPGRSFVGIAFNIENDSTYEAVYFRPFNFQSKEEIRRAHSIQYISHPKNTWRYLRTNYEGQYEAEYARKPSPEEWFKVEIKIDNERVRVYDTQTKAEMLSVKRIAEPSSDKIALWTGFNSKGEFKNLKIK